MYDNGIYINSMDFVSRTAGMLYDILTDEERLFSIISENNLSVNAEVLDVNQSYKSWLTATKKEAASLCGSGDLMTQGLLHLINNEGQFDLHKIYETLKKVSERMS